MAATGTNAAFDPRVAQVDDQCMVVVPTGIDAPLANASDYGEIIMQRDREKRVEDEPVGIVISRGSREQVEPRFVAYVWGPAPKSADGATKADVKAA